jgi:hypothetical protein
MPGPIARHSRIDGLHLYPFLFFAEIFGGEHDYWNIPPAGVSLFFDQKIEPIHDRHHQIQQDQVWRCVRQTGERFLAIADDRPLAAITDTLDSGTGAGSGDSIAISHPATRAATRGHILSN